MRNKILDFLIFSVKSYLHQEQQGLLKIGLFVLLDIYIRLVDIDVPTLSLDHSLNPGPEAPARLDDVSLGHLGPGLPDVVLEGLDICVGFLARH